jgi:NADP-dependent 3-hydroxy acid dehydrogenase YdfG
VRLGLSGSVALITGATSGIGLATARSMVAEGARVVTVSRGPDGPNIGEALHVTADLFQSGEPERTVEAAESSLGRIDILVNNVGHAAITSLDELTGPDREFALRANLLTAIGATRAALPWMLGRHRGFDRQHRLHRRPPAAGRRRSCAALPDGAAHRLERDGVPVCRAARAGPDRTASATRRRSPFESLDDNTTVALASRGSWPTTDRSTFVSKSIAVFGAGPGLGQAVVRRYAREGYAVTLVARRPDPLDRLAKELTSGGATAHVITADLADTGATPQLAEQIRAKAGDLDAIYYAPTPATGFVSAASLTPRHAERFMPLIFYTLLALVEEFLPHMLEQGDGAVLTAQGGSTVQGLPYMSGPSPAQAAQRNYLQALHAEVAGKGVYVGMLYIGAAIENSAFHVELEAAKATGEPVWEMPTVDPDHLAELLWTMHSTKGPREVIYPT